MTAHMGYSTSAGPLLDLPYRDRPDPAAGYHRLAVPHTLRTDELVAATAAFLARLTGVPDGEIGLLDRRHLRLFDHVTPIGPGEFESYVQHMVERHPRVADAMPVVIELHADLDAPAHRARGLALLVRVTPAGRCEWHVADPTLSHRSAVALRDAFIAFLDALARPEQCAHQVIGEQAEQHPATPALLCARGTVTYGQLADRMRRLAGGLQRHGVGPGDLVGLCLPRSSDLVVAMLGVMRTGAAAVPVDPNGPVQRVVEDLSVRLVLTDSRHTGLISGAPRVKMDRLRLRESEPGFDDARPDLPACVLSTDRRAVRIGHSALVNLLPAGFGTALELLRPLMTGETVSLRPVPLARPPVARRWDLADAAQHAS